MGGQACVLYGAAQFSRDTDVVIMADADNLKRLQDALAELQAKCIAVPPFEPEYLRRGHAIHFRCHHPETAKQRLDVMAVMRGVAPFPELWQRRSTATLETGFAVELISLPDLVAAKKTQRDKDWPMIQQLVEVNYRDNVNQADQEHVEFWLRESRYPGTLLNLAGRFPVQTEASKPQRPLLALAQAQQLSDLAVALKAEEDKERQADRAYWAPLLKELEQLRLQRRNP